MEELVNNAVLLSVVLAPIITGLVQVVKSAIDIGNRYLPLVSLITGVVVALLVAVGTDQDLIQYALVGVISGLGSSGLYDNIDSFNK